MKTRLEQSLQRAIDLIRARVSEECLFMLLGEVVEHSRTEDLFLTLRDSRTADYIEGRYG